MPPARMGVLVVMVVDNDVAADTRVRKVAATPAAAVAAGGARH